MVRLFLALVVVSTLTVSTGGRQAAAAIVNWTIDPEASFVRLTIPDQATTLPPTSQFPDGLAATVRVRNANNNSTWTDDGARLARVGGTVRTDYQDGTSIRFLAGQHNLFALEEHSLRPNPDAFDSGATDALNPSGQYSNTTTELAAYGGKIRVTTHVIVSSDFAYFSLRNVLFDWETGTLPVASGTTIPSAPLEFGITSAESNYDGFNWGPSSSWSQVSPDAANALIDGVIGGGSGSGTITDLGGGLRRLTYQFGADSDWPDGVAVSGGDFALYFVKYSGTIVAYATIPEPSTFTLGAAGGLAILGLSIPRHRQNRRLRACAENREAIDRRAVGAVETAGPARWGSSHGNGHRGR